MQQIKDIEKYSDTKAISTFHTTISMPEPIRDFAKTPFSLSTILPERSKTMQNLFTS